MPNDRVPAERSFRNYFSGFSIRIPGIIYVPNDRVPAERTSEAPFASYRDRDFRSETVNLPILHTGERKRSENAMRILGKLAHQASFARRRSIHNLRSFLTSSSSLLTSHFHTLGALKQFNFAPSVSPTIDFSISKPWSHFLGLLPTFLLSSL